MSIFKFLHEGLFDLLEYTEELLPELGRYDTPWSCNARHNAAAILEDNISYEHLQDLSQMIFTLPLQILAAAERYYTSSL